MIEGVTSWDETGYVFIYFKNLYKVLVKTFGRGLGLHSAGQLTIMWQLALLCLPVPPLPVPKGNTFWYYPVAEGEITRLKSL